MVILLLIIVIITPVGAPILAANMDGIIKNHWSKDLIDKDFFVYYFPYLAKENFKRFEPNGAINEDEFLLSFSSLLKDNGYANSLLGWSVELSRREMAKVIGGRLIEEKLIVPSGNEIPFTDIKHMADEEQKIIEALHQSGIIEGQTKTIYNPGRKVTQAEAIIVLQRVGNLLEKVNTISFKLSGVVQSYSGKEGITFKTEGDKVLVTITKEFPTPGYSIGVDKIIRSKDEHKIYLSITPPRKDADLLQVITYKTITIEIEKENIGDPPYNFVLGDFFIS